MAYKISKKHTKQLFKGKKGFYLKAKKGISRKLVEEISDLKKEPRWMRRLRLKAYDAFTKSQTPNFGPCLKDLKLDDIHLYLKAIKGLEDSWDKLPKKIKDTYDKLGIPQAEQKYLGGVAAQYESEVVYKSIKKTLEKKGVIFLDMDTALKKMPDIIKNYFGTLVRFDENMFTALNGAFWSGGSFIYVPKGVEVQMPLQAYFRLNAANIGQFERTLIIAEEDSFIHYVEGCTAPIYSRNSLHAAVVEIFVKKGARMRYTTVQNWSKNVYNLVTKRMKVGEDAVGEWIDGNIGSKVTMKYPSLVLSGKRSRGEIMSLAYASKDQHIDSGGKVIHLAPDTSSQVISKSVSKKGGRSSYRGKAYIDKKAIHSKTKVSCDALILDDLSRSDTYPLIEVNNKDAKSEHEASVSSLDKEKILYLQTRGFSPEEAESLIVNGFMEPIVKHLPLEYAVELNRLIKLDMQGSIG